MARLYRTDEKTREAIRKGCLSFFIIIQICFPQKQKMEFFSNPTKGKTRVVSLTNVDTVFKRVYYAFECSLYA